MRDRLKFAWACVADAARGTIERANAWAWLLGALVLYGILHLWGYELMPPDTMPGVILLGAICLAVAWFIVFAWRLFGAPYRLHLISIAEIKRLKAAIQAPLSDVVASLPTWIELEQRFKELEPALQFSRIDGQTGAAGEFWRIAGSGGQDAETRFNAVAAMASARLFQDFPDEFVRHKELALESDPSIRWYKALQYIGNRYKSSGFIAKQINDDGSSGGFLYTGSIDKPAAASVTLCLALASRTTRGTK